MRKYVWHATLLIALSGAAVSAQKVTSADGLDKAMKNAGKASGALAKALGAGDFAGAKTQSTALRQAIKDSQAFWADKKKADGVQFANDVLAKVDALDKALAAATPDKAAAGTAYREATTACGACHKVYRVTDEENNFILKPNSMN